VIFLPILLWDASALAKPYVPEVGSDTAIALLAATAAATMMGTIVGYAETFSVLLRNRNRGTISPSTFAGAKSLLRIEVAENPDFVMLAVDDAVFFGGLALMERHNLNAADAATLYTFLTYARSTPSPPPVVLVASDHRLLTSARAEGLATLNPEALPAANVPAFLAAL
jgi:predicted nucleic acid-binding protein